MIEQIRSRVVEPTADGIAAAIGSLIGDGTLTPGDKLPTVRTLAGQLGVSANTVADAWKILQNHGAIKTERRRGTTVRSTRNRAGGRYWQVPVEPGTIELDLSTGTPDSDLLPPIGPVLHHLHTDVAVSSYLDPPLVAGLEEELRRRWPFEPASITVVDGAQDALDRVVSEVVHLGDTVVIEDPTFPPTLDMLDLAGARVVGIPLDGEGPRLQELSEAMESQPAAIFIQPRAHNPTGVHISRERSEAIADLVKGTRTIVVEDDHSAGAAGVAIESVGQFVPDAVVHIHSFSKSHGPDLRIAAVSGPSAIIENVVRRRQLGPSWTSRLIQQILLTMLADTGTDQLVNVAADEYHRRRGELGRLLEEQGVTVEQGLGLNMWIPVNDEQRAVVALAAHGIGVAPGAPFRTSPATEQHIRLSLGPLRGDLERVARLVAMAASAPPISAVS